MVLPDFQGVGIGVRLLNYIAKKYTNEGWRLTITTSNPALIFSLKHKKEWHMPLKRLRIPPSKSKKAKRNQKINAFNRLTTTFVYVKQQR